MKLTTKALPHWMALLSAALLAVAFFAAEAGGSSRPVPPQKVILSVDGDTLFKAEIELWYEGNPVSGALAYELTSYNEPCNLGTRVKLPLSVANAVADRFQLTADVDLEPESVVTRRQVLAELRDAPLCD